MAEMIPKPAVIKHKQQNVTNAKKIVHYTSTISHLILQSNKCKC